VVIARRPKPPPAIIVFSSTFSGATPSTLAIAPWSMVWNCEPTHTLAPLILPPSFCTSIVQLSGSIGACAR
jgi:hypothetical protein